MLDQDFVAAFNQCAEGDEIGHRCSDGRNNVLRGRTGFLGQSLLQRRIAVTAGTIDLDIFNPRGKVGEWVIHYSAGGEIETRAGTELRPGHVKHRSVFAQIHSLLLFREFHKKYTGTPASKIDI